MSGSLLVRRRVPRVLSLIVVVLPVLALGCATGLAVAWVGATASGRLDFPHTTPVATVGHEGWSYAIRRRAFVEWHSLERYPGCTVDAFLDRERGWRLHGAAVADAFRGESPGWMLDTKRENPDANFMDLVRAGWPLRCVEGLAWIDYANRLHPPRRTESLIEERRVQAPLLGEMRLIAPLRPIPVGLAADTLVFAALWALVGVGGRGGARFGLRSVRRQRGRCPKCAYDLKRDFASGCPECGWNRAGVSVVSSGLRRAETSA